MSILKKRFTGGLVVENSTNRQFGLSLKAENATAEYTLSVPNTGVGALEISLPATGTQILSDTSTVTLSNKSLEVATTSFVDTTNSKNAKFALSQANSTSVVFTLPPSTDTLVARTSTDTLTNKSISALSNTITDISNASISASAAIAYSKLNLVGSIINADISASAAIDYSKLASLTASRALISNASGIVTPSAVTSTELALLSGLTGTIVTTTGTQVLTNKDYDIQTASNTSRLTLGKNTKTNLDALTRKEATVLYGTDTKQLYIDDGTQLLAVGGSWSSFTTESISNSGNISLSTTIGLQYRRIQGNGSSVTTALTPFGTTAPPDGTVVRLVGQSSSNSVVINNYDAAKGTLLNGIAEIKYGDVLELQYDAILDRYVETFRNF